MQASETLFFERTYVLWLIKIISESWENVFMHDKNIALQRCFSFKCFKCPPSNNQL